MLRVTCVEKPRWFVRSYAPQRIWISSSVTKNFLVELEFVPNWQGFYSMLLLLFLPVVAGFKTNSVIQVCFEQQIEIVLDVFNRNNQFAKSLATILKSGLLTKSFTTHQLLKRKQFKKINFWVEVCLQTLASHSIIHSITFLLRNFCPFLKMRTPSWAFLDKNLIMNPQFKTCRILNWNFSNLPDC